MKQISNPNDDGADRASTRSQEADARMRQAFDAMLTLARERALPSRLEQTQISVGKRSSDRGPSG
ncbi:MAG: hypothetical protein AAF494_14325 [Pseudomonadota bacterium]